MAMRTGCINFNIIKFLYTLHRIYIAIFKQSAITLGWGKTGLILYNPKLILTKLRRQTAVAYLYYNPASRRARQTRRAALRNV